MFEVANTGCQIMAMCNLCAMLFTFSINNNTRRFFESEEVILEKKKKETGLTTAS